LGKLKKHSPAKLFSVASANLNHRSAKILAGGNRIGKRDPEHYFCAEIAVQNENYFFEYREKGIYRELFELQVGGFITE
jgi:hypothetical protein